MAANIKLRLKILCGAIIIACAAFFLGSRTRVSVLSSGWSGPRRLQDETYKFISPLIACDVSENTDYQEYNALKNNIAGFVRDQTTAGALTDAGIYFRDLNSGAWIGYNEQKKFWPASLIKVPAMIAFLRSAEINPTLLSKKIMFVPHTDLNVSETYKPSHPVVAGHEYSTQDLLTAMIRYSDNNAAVELVNVFDKNILDEVFSDAGLTAPEITGATQDYMSPKSYAFFFRMLFNGSYLNRSFSEYALSELAQTDFAQGLVAGVPNDVPVAHKFGEQGTPPDGSQGDQHELHDCGIVYYPGHPYILCIMTKGTSFSALTKAIAQISQITFTEVDARYHAR